MLGENSQKKGKLKLAEKCPKICKAQFCHSKRQFNNWGGFLRGVGGHEMGDLDGFDEEAASAKHL